MHINNLLFSSLPISERTFLGPLKTIDQKVPACPVYYKKSDANVFFVSDFRLPESSIKEFEKTAPGSLYRGGAVIIVICKYGILVVPDERYRWLKPFAGLARFEEGHDLRQTGARELMEEAFMFRLDKRIRYVPKGCAGDKYCSLDFAVERTQEFGGLTLINYKEVGEIILVDFEVNETNKALEAVLSWDISGIEEEYSVNLEEEWYSGGRSGIPVFVVNNIGNIVGLFSGQQGFQDIDKFGIHTTLKKYLYLARKIV